MPAIQARRLASRAVFLSRARPRTGSTWTISRIRFSWKAPICFRIKLQAWGRVSNLSPLSLAQEGHGREVLRDCSSVSARSSTSPRSKTRRRRIIRATARPSQDSIEAKTGKSHLPKRFATWVWLRQRSSTTRRSRPGRSTCRRMVTSRLAALLSLMSR